MHTNLVVLSSRKGSESPGVYAGGGVGGGGGGGGL